MREFGFVEVFYDQRGPLVLSASLHLIALVAFGIWALMGPHKLPEELVFELVSPPAGAYVEEMPLTAIEEFQSEDVPMPDPEEFESIEEALVPIEMPPEPEPALEEAPPQQQISIDDFEALRGRPIEIQNQRPEQDRQTQTIDLSEHVESLKQELTKFRVPKLSQSQMDSLSASDQALLSAYWSGFVKSIADAVEKTAHRGLSVTLSCDISSGGFVTNERIVRSSGDSEFDRKALAAFKAVRYYLPPPNNKQQIGLEFDLYQPK